MSGLGWRRARRRFGIGVAVILLMGVAGCAGVVPAPTPVPTPSSTATPLVPPDGIGLATLGVRNGPAQFLLPAGTVASMTVDQPNGVVLVVSAPDPTEVADYLRLALPAAGFALTEPAAAETFTFRGHGWSGGFTSSEDSAVILLRPL